MPPPIEDLDDGLWYTHALDQLPRKLSDDALSGRKAAESGELPALEESADTSRGRTPSALEDLTEVLPESKSVSLEELSEVLQASTSSTPLGLKLANEPSSRASSRPAKQHFENDGNALFDEAGIYVGSHVAPSVVSPETHSLSVQIPRSTLVTPRSRYDDFDAKAPECGEWKAVKSLLAVSDLGPDEDFVEFDLDHFAVYTHSSTDNIKPYDEQRYPYEMKPLQYLGTKSGWGCTTLYVDGYLSCGDTAFFVRKMPFEALPIGNYGHNEHTVGDQIWIRTTLNENNDNTVYYKLKKPAPEYARYHTGFLWITDLAKHVIDYMVHMEQEQTRVEFWHFESLFNRWLLRVHGQDRIFRRWLRQHGGRDFRTAVHAYQDFIYKEAHGVLGAKGVAYHPVWKEIRDFTAYKPSGSTRAGRDKSDTLNEVAGEPNGHDESIPPTIVTPYIYDCFSHLPFASMMQKTEPSAKTQLLREALISKQHLEQPSKLHGSPKQMKAESQNGFPSNKAIVVGDVISTHHDEEDGHWQRQEATGFDDVDRWFGLVQKVHTSRTGRRSFDVIWIYRPVDTICGTMKYPWNNELFVSDHCSCHDGMPKVTEAEVLGVHTVQWGGSSTTEAEFFCRQTYLHEARRWVTFADDHLICSHRKETGRAAYVPGDTLLVLPNSNTRTLEPCVLLALNDTACTASVIIFKRRQEIDPLGQFRPNELVYCEDAVTELKTSRIHGKCILRHFQPQEAVVSPYDRDGVGNAFFIRTRAKIVDGSLIYLPFDDQSPFPGNIRQGFDPGERFRKLKGFDLFCGGGNFGRGLEDAGAIDMKWANDINSRAIHTYMANLSGNQKRKVHPFLGSIDDLQRLALQGEFSKNVPEVGQVEFVSGGSPCPGFSRLTVDKTTPEQRKNQSLVASFASFIDVYRPKFGLLENVVEIIQGKKTRSEDVFCQLICAIVGLGYQAHFFLLDAWTFGSPQSRSRVFLAFAAPGLRLPEMPQQSHSHLPSDQRTRTLGWLPNGEPMVQRQFPPTPFAPVTAADAVADLPDIGDGKADCCIPFPDHRQCYGVTRAVRLQFGLIPIQPYGMNFSKAYYDSKVITEAERRVFPTGRRTQEKARGWGRVHPRRIMSTVTTTPNPTDSFVGGCMHWNQPRILSVMEVRRAQGFRDHEVILGEPKLQWATIGNSVAREVSLALGLSFREAWLGSLVKGDENLRVLPSTQNGIAKPVKNAIEPSRPQATGVGAVVDLTTDDGDSDELADLLLDPKYTSPQKQRDHAKETIDDWDGSTPVQTGSPISHTGMSPSTSDRLPSSKRPHTTTMTAFSAQTISTSAPEDPERPFKQARLDTLQF